MPKMYKDGCEPIVVHDSQIHNAQAREWLLEKQTKAKQIKSKGVVKNGKS